MVATSVFLDLGRQEDDGGLLSSQASLPRKLQFLCPVQCRQPDRDF